MLRRFLYALYVVYAILVSLMGSCMMLNEGSNDGYNRGSSSHSGSGGWFHK